MRQDLTRSECAAVLIALDELVSYVETVEGDFDDRERGKVDWATRKLTALLKEHDVTIPWQTETGA